MGQLKRIFVYIFFYFILLQFLQTLVIGGVANSQDININQVEDAFKTLLSYATFIYISIVIFLDYLSNKKRKRGAK